MEKSDFNKKWRQMVLKQQYSEVNVENLKKDVKTLAKTSLDILQEMPDEIEMQEIAVSADFALLLIESLEDAILHINSLIKTRHEKMMKEQTKTEDNGNNDNGAEDAG